MLKPLTDAFLRKRLIKRQLGIKDTMDGIPKMDNCLRFSNIVKTLSYTLILLIFVAEIHAAQPTIVGYSGEIQNGNSITILGNDFVNDNTANWINTESGAGLENDTDFAASKTNDDGWIQEDSLVLLWGRTKLNARLL